MSIEDYQKNLRGVNAGSDFSPEFLVRDLDNPIIHEPTHVRTAKHIRFHPETRDSNAGGAHWATGI